MTDSEDNSATGMVHMNITAKPTSLFSVDVPRAVPAGENVYIPITLHVVSTEPHYYFRVVPQENFYTNSYPQEAMYFIIGWAPEEPCTVSLRVECIRVSWETGEISDVLEAQTITFAVEEGVEQPPTLNITGPTTVYEYEPFEWDIDTGNVLYSEIDFALSSDNNNLASNAIINKYMGIYNGHYVLGMFKDSFNGDVKITATMKESGLSSAYIMPVATTRPPAGRIIESVHIETGNNGVATTTYVTIPRRNTWGSYVYRILFKAGSDITSMDTCYGYTDEMLIDKNMMTWEYESFNSGPTTDSQILIQSPSTARSAIRLTDSAGRTVSTTGIKRGSTNGYFEIVNYAGQNIPYIGVALVEYPSTFPF